MDFAREYHFLDDSISFLKRHLNQQGPLEYFVHHNPLHSLEDLKFHAAIRQSGELYGATGYMASRDYRFIFKHKKISSNILLHEIENTFFNDEFLGSSNITPALLLELLQSEKTARSFRKSSKSYISQFATRIRSETESLNSNQSSLCPERAEFRSALSEFNLNIDEWVTFYFGHILSVYFDAGHAYWPVAYQDTMLKTIVNTFGKKGWFSKPWKKSFQRDLMKFTGNVNVRENIIRLLSHLNIEPEHYKSFLYEICSRQKGWSGFVLKAESSPHLLHSNPAIKSNFEEFLLLLVLIEKSLVEHYYNEFDLPIIPKITPRATELDSERALVYALLLTETLQLTPSDSVENRISAFTPIIKVALKLAATELSIWQNAFDKTFTADFLSAVVANKKANKRSPQSKPKAQVITCIDEREESFRRHLEEVQPQIQTFGFAGNFALNLLFKGVNDVRFKQFGDLSKHPDIKVEESIVEYKNTRNASSSLVRLFYKIEASLLRRPKDFLFGWITSLSMGFVVLPHIILKIFFPYREEVGRRALDRWLKSQFKTALQIYRLDGDELDALAKAKIVRGVLTANGLKHFSDLVFIVGHGSHSLNNPHEAAHDCGACGGGRGIINARVFALFANDSAVRAELSSMGINIPEQCTFVPAYHDTCSDEFRVFELDATTRATRDRMQSLKNDFAEACRRDAHERCRKFSDVPRKISLNAAQAHVIGRANDLSQPRPEYGHATNAICIIGSRNLSRGIFLDRRAFLCSYDFKSDDDAGILSSLLESVVGVCSGINLEYYFATVDNRHYGSGTKLPHNVVSLQAVINGTDSDLLLGLPTQMIEIHAPLRLNVMIEAPLSRIKDLVQRPNSLFGRLTRNEWIWTIVLDPEDQSLYKYESGEFVRIEAFKQNIATFKTSQDVYNRIRGYCDFSLIEPDSLYV